MRQWTATVDMAASIDDHAIDDLLDGLQAYSAAMGVGEDTLSVTVSIESDAGAAAAAADAERIVVDGVRDAGGEVDDVVALEVMTWAEHDRRMADS